MFRITWLSSKGTIPFLLLVLMPMICLAQTAKSGASQTVQADPPFSGTIFIDPDIITSSDSTTFQSVSYSGQGSRTMYDRRVNNWITVNAYLFDASFDDGLTAEIQVNPEFDSTSAALAEAQKYGWVIGQLPTALRADVQTVWIHKGIQPFGGGNNNLLIHIGQADLYAADGILEETFVHEASHTSLDAAHASAPGWLAAQAADGNFISTYARDFPNREDIAESFLLYLAVRYRSDRISQSLAETILQTMPNRISYFDNQSFDMYPISTPTTSVDEPFTPDFPKTFVLFQNYPNPFNPSTTIQFDLPRRSEVRLSIYNINGQLVRTLIDRKFDAGSYSVLWDGRDERGRQATSGLFVTRMKAGEFVQHSKMLLIK